MKKQILNLGKGLSKAEQKVINGGEMSGGGYIVKCNTDLMFEVDNCGTAADTACPGGWTVCA